MVSSLLITLLLGSQITFFSDVIVSTMLETFKQYPYLFQGEWDYTKNYFDQLSSHNHSALITATVGQEFAGFLLGCPLLVRKNQFADALEFFKAAHIDPSHCYYYSDVIVVPAFQRQGVAKKLFTTLEQQVRKWGYQAVCLVSVERNKDHPLRPSNYDDTDTVWRHLGFIKSTIYTKDSWPTFIDLDGTVEMREHLLVFWIKELTNC